MFCYDFSSRAAGVEISIFEPRTQKNILAKTNTLHDESVYFNFKIFKIYCFGEQFPTKTLRTVIKTWFVFNYPELISLKSLRPRLNSRIHTPYHLIFCSLGLTFMLTLTNKSHVHAHAHDHAHAGARSHIHEDWRSCPRSRSRSHAINHTIN